jgi:hypothetical protein
LGRNGTVDPWFFTREAVAMSDTNPMQTVLQLATGYWVPRCLHAIAELGVADVLGDAPQTAQALASALQLDPLALARVLRALAACGVFAEVDGQFAHTPASRLLRSDDPQSQRSLVRMMGMPVHWAAFGELAYAIRSGDAAVSRLVPDGIFGYLAAHPAEGRLFDEAMTGKAHGQIASVLASYDFSQFQLIADIGGGRGHLLQRVLEAAPQARGVLCDLPHVVGALESQSSARLTLQAVDFFKDPLPACDAYLLMSVIHDWGDADAIRILQAVRRAAPANARLLLLELLVPETPGPHFAKFLDIEMLVMTHGGRERTRADYERLYLASGFRLERVIPTPGPTTIIEGAVVR